ncbi:ral guanine nucleotide dissociation stimulator-like [Choloepus didactylus]|uniref:ral guanine nucleotide dissociation stimulator-like n=1 Tax=Choloepus didactylus TaxID=27675 RepID=UPI00189ED79C|nr:ral guanine nucleotide dissociation stimulator-like [Choloepus didactylus]
MPVMLVVPEVLRQSCLRCRRCQARAARDAGGAEPDLPTRANTPAHRRVQNSLERTPKERVLDKLMELLVLAVQEGDRVYVTNLLINYRGFLSIEEVLDQVSKRGAFRSHLHGPCLRDMRITAVLVMGMEEARKASKRTPTREVVVRGQCGPKGRSPHPAAHPSTPSSISCLLLTWLEELPADFCQHPGVPCLKQLVVLAQVALPGSALERHAQDLLSLLEPAEPSETATEAPVLDPEVKTSSVPPAEPVPSMALPPVPHAVAEPLQARELQPPTPATFIPRLELEATLKPPAVPPPEVAISPAAASLTEPAVALRPPLLPEVEAFTAPDVEPSSSPADTPSPELEAGPLPRPEVVTFPTEELEPVN